MNVVVAQWLARLIEAYLVVGVAFSIPFAWRGAARLDAAAGRSTWGFRLLLLPASATLWPLLAWRWRRGAGAPPVETNAHRRRSSASARP